MTVDNRKTRPDPATPVREQPFPVARSLDYYLVPDIRRPVQGAVAGNGADEEAQTFLHVLVAGDDEAENPVAVEERLVQVCRLPCGEPMEAQVYRVVRKTLPRERLGPQCCCYCWTAPNTATGGSGSATINDSPPHMQPPTPLPKPSL